MRRHWRAAAAWAFTVAIISIVVEALIAYMKDERYSISRAVIVLSVLAVAAVVVLGINRPATRPRLALDLAPLAMGLIVALVAVGAIITKSHELSYVFDGSLAGLGLLISALSGYRIYVQRTGADLMAIGGRARQPISVESRGETKVSVGKFPAFAPEDAEILELCAAVVRPDDVHFVAYYVNGECRFYVDSFDSPELNRFFGRIDRAERRAQYERAGRQVEWIISRLNVYMKHLERGILIRSVFDVEQGSLAYYYIDRGVYIAAVTMDQSKVHETDDRLRDLVNHIGLLPRGWLARPGPSSESRPDSGRESALSLSRPVPSQRTIICVDVERFGTTDRARLDARSNMYDALRAAFARSGIDWAELQLEDRGDGVLVLVPPDVPTSRLVTRLPAALAAALHDYNAGRDDDARLRLRLALHSGEVQYDAHGLIGNALSDAFRLVAAPELRSALSGSAGTLAMITSNAFYQEAIRPEPGAAASSYRPVRVTAKATEINAWIYLPDDLDDALDRAIEALGGRQADYLRSAGGPVDLPRQIAERIRRLSANEDLPTTVTTVFTGLDRLFQRLGPPPDPVPAEQDPVLSGDGGAAG